MLLTMWRHSMKKKTNFHKNWNIPAKELAVQENCMTQAIHMRVLHFGNPFQRRSRPSSCEILTGKLIAEHGKTTGMHPVSVANNLRQYGEIEKPNKKVQGRWNRGAQYAAIHWSELRQFKNQVTWLMPCHPDYEWFRSDSTTADQRRAYAEANAQTQKELKLSRSK